MTEPIRKPCKQCGIQFDQPRVQGHPWNYCSYGCTKRSHNERYARVKRERHRAMRAAGVPADIASSACCSKWRFEYEMRKVGALCSG